MGTGTRGFMGPVMRMIKLRDLRGQSIQSKGAPTDKRTSPTSTPMASLFFGSFQAASVLSRLWGDRVEIEDLDEQGTLPAHSQVIGSRPIHVSGGIEEHLRQDDPQLTP